jgi:hypothetical protein
VSIRQPDGVTGHATLLGWRAVNQTDQAIDRTDLTNLEGALDALETLHDFEADQFRSERIRYCLCAEASYWRKARHVVKRLRSDLGLNPRLIWTV